MKTLKYSILNFRIENHYAVEYTRGLYLIAGFIRQINPGRIYLQITINSKCY